MMNASPGVVVQADLPAAGEQTQMQVGDAEVQQAKRRQKQILVGAILVVVVLLAIIIGLAVGLSQNGGGGNSSTSNVVASSGPPTPAPVAGGGSSREAIQNYLVANTISDAAAFSSPSSPQSQALDFIAGEAPPIPSDPTSPQAYKFMERYVLSVLYFSTNGDSWTYHYSFNDNSLDTCFWNARVITSSDTDFRGVFCNVENGPVVAIRLIDNSMGGKIPKELGLLTSLVSVNFRTNLFIGGRIPDTMQGLTKLTYLAFHFNQMTGTFPTWIGSLTRLQVFAISNNQIGGSFPASISQLSNLEILAADDNLMTGDFSQIDSLSRLRLLYLEDNGFSATVDSTLFANLPALEHLDLSDNSLVGTLPVHFFQYENLTVLDLHDNGLTQSLPPNIPVNRRLQFLALQANSFTGVVPPSLTNLQALFHLDLSSNNFIGTMPEELGSISNLKYLFLADTTFDKGPIPSTYQDLTLMEDLSLKDSRRNGNIPTWFGKLDQIWLLDLDSNQLDGSIPTEIGGMANLRFLLLNRNFLTGPIPSELGSLNVLVLALLENNTITGDANLVCSGKPDLRLVTDCGGQSPEVTCACCALCCVDAELCNDFDYFAQQDPIWEQSYTRITYDFAVDYNITR